METFVIIITILFAAWWIYNTVSQNTVIVLEKLSAIQRQLNDLRKETSLAKDNMLQQAKPIEVTKPAVHDTVTTTVLPAPASTPLPKPGIPIKKEPEPALDERVLNTLEGLVNESLAANAYAPTSKKIPQKPAVVEGFWAKNPDLEKFVGENLINKIGIAILVLGIGFFVKYAIDNNWINEYGRTAIGIVTGLGLIGLAHRLHKNYLAFSSVLIGGGLAVLYLTIGIAFHLYALVGQTTAFGLMVSVTAGAVFLSLHYNRIELAILALLGGFGTPFFVSTGHGDYRVLFTYVLILVTGMTALAYFKKWPLVTAIGFLGTILLFGGWLTSLAGDEKPIPTPGAIVFATNFFVLFFLMNTLYSLRYPAKLQAYEFLLLLGNALFYLLSGLYILSTSGLDFLRGTFVAVLGLAHLGAMRYLRPRIQLDPQLITLLLALALTFLTLAIPIQFHGSPLVLFWAAEAVILFILWQRTQSKILITFSQIVIFLTISGTLYTWLRNYTFAETEDPTFWVSGTFWAGLIVTASFQLLRRLLKQVPHERKADFEMPVTSWQAILRVAVPVLLYSVPILELNRIMVINGLEWNMRALVLGMYNFSAYALGLYVYRKNLVWELSVVMYVLGVGLLLFFLGIVLESLDILLQAYIAGGYSFTYWLHVFIFMTVPLSSFLLYQRASSSTSKEHAVSAWSLVAVLLFFASVQLHFLGVALYATTSDVGYVAGQVHRAGFSILWGIVGFLLIYVGLQQKQRLYRIIALSVLGVTLLKLFLFDLSNVSETGKIIAFICLGVLLLVISFLYQRLKQLVIGEDDNTSPPSTTRQSG